MRLLARIVCVLLFVAALLFVGAGLFLPSTMEVERSIEVNVPPEHAFEEVGDFRNWPRWMPWYQEDPAMAISYAGTPSGVGMVMTWDSKKHGIGRINISHAEEDETLRMSVEFNRQGASVLDWKFQPGPEKTCTITVRFTSDFGQNYAGRYIGWVSRDYTGERLEKTLTGLKEQTEARLAKKQAKAAESPSAKP